MEKNIKKYFPAFVLPTLLAFVAAFLVPFLMGIFLSFTRFSTVSDAKWVGVINYVKAFTAGDGFGHSILFTVLFAAVSIISVNVVAFGLALLLSRGIRGTNFFRSVFFMPNLIGGIVLGYIWNLLINGVLSIYGADITLKTEYGFWGLVVVYNWQMIGYMMIIYIAGLQNIPGDMLEASSIDGANAVQTLFMIKLPALMPSVTICSFLTLANSFKLFDQNLALTAGAPEKSTEMIALNIYNTFYGRVGWQGIGQAKAVIFFVIVAIIGFIQLKATSEKEG